MLPGARRSDGRLLPDPAGARRRGAGGARRRWRPDARAGRLKRAGAGARPAVAGPVRRVARADVMRGDLGRVVRQRPADRPRHLRSTSRARSSWWSSPWLIGLALGIPAGVASAIHQDRWPDHLLTGGSLLAVSVPSFVSGTLLLLLLRAPAPLAAGLGVRLLQR